MRIEYLYCDICDDNTPHWVWSEALNCTSKLARTVNAIWSLGMSEAFAQTFYSCQRCNELDTEDDDFY